LSIWLRRQVDDPTSLAKEGQEEGLGANAIDRPVATDFRPIYTTRPVAYAEPVGVCSGRFHLWTSNLGRDPTVKGGDDVRITEVSCLSQRGFAAQ